MIARKIFFGLSVVLVLASNAAAAPGDTIYVQVKESRITAEPKLWGAGVANVAHGDALVEESRENNWVHVSLADGQKGYIHAGAVTPKRIVLKGRPAALGAEEQSSDIVLAGKGFNKDIEERHAQEDISLNYQAVDVIENWTVKPESLRAFLIEGQLNIEGANESID